VLQPYQTLHTNVMKSSVVLFLAEMLKNCIREEEANGGLFQYISSALQWLDVHDDISGFHQLFLLKLTTYLGFYPDTSHSDLPYFNLMEGIFQKKPLGNYCEKGEAVDTLKSLFGINFDALTLKKTTKKQRFEVLDLLLLYYQLHLHGYKKPRSLLVLNQLFN
jgi:DNA repair protein RecO (recombination protein O)